MVVAIQPRRLPELRHIQQMLDVRLGDSAALAIDAPLSAGSKLDVQQGLVEVVFDSGARMILQGPAEAELQSGSSVDLRSGSLTAEVPTPARGFAIHTPNSTVVDLGTKFGVSCRAGQTDVEVFTGSVLVRVDDTQPGGIPQEMPLAANSAIRVNGVPGHGALKIEQLVSGSRHFVQSLTGSASLLQTLAENDPHLIHFYPFEGATNTERLRDRRGNLDLHEVTMRDGDAGGRLEYARTGPDPSTHVVVPYRANNSAGPEAGGCSRKPYFIHRQP